MNAPQASRRSSSASLMARFLCAGAVAMLTIAGCGSGSDPSSSSNGGDGSFVFAANGGNNQKAIMEACVEPFAKERGLKAVGQEVPAAKYDILRRQGKVDIDVIYNVVDQPGAADWSDMLTPIDYSIVDKSAVPPMYATDFGVGHDIFAYTIVYNTEKYGANPPKTWADFFDTKRFPGKRGFPSVDLSGPQSIVYALASGLTGQVPTPTPIDVNAISNFLREVRGDVIFFKKSAQSPQLFQTGQVDMAMMLSSHVAPLISGSVPVAIQWAQNLTTADWLEVPKDAPNPQLSMEFINYCMSAEAQAKYSQIHPNAPVNPAAVPLLPTDLREKLPTNYTDGSNPISSTYWTDPTVRTFIEALQKVELGG